MTYPDLRQTVVAVGAEAKVASPARSAPALAGTVPSPDGTAIAFDRIGSGPLVILIDGALCYRRMGPCRQLAECLWPHFTVITYDRRGRGESGDTSPYGIEREVEDIGALLAEAGGTAFVWGTSSGAVLALEAAKRLSGIKKLAMFEPPFIVDHSRPAMTDDWARIAQAVAGHRRSDAVKIFLKSVGVPDFFVAVMPLLHMWSKLKAVAHTLPYDGAIVADNQRGKPLPSGR
jgi:pimeloyl-ACP methyl ester carboxylesterase